MSYFETYRSRLLSQGNSSAESVINTTKQVVNNSFDTSLSTKTVLIDGVSIIAIVNQGKSSEEKSILFKPDTVIDKGTVVTIDSLNYLAMDFEANEVYPVAQVRLCNSTFPIQSDKTQVLLTDEFGNPILNDFGEQQYEWTYLTEDVPCIVEAKITSDSVEEAINLPEGRLDIIIPYRESEGIAEGKQFSMYGSSYQIIGIDYTKSVNKKGILTLQGKKV